MSRTENAHTILCEMYERGREKKRMRWVMNVYIICISICLSGCYIRWDWIEQAAASASRGLNRRRRARSSTWMDDPLYFFLSCRRRRACCYSTACQQTVHLREREFVPHALFRCYIAWHDVCFPSMMIKACCCCFLPFFFFCSRGSCEVVGSFWDRSKWFEARKSLIEIRASLKFFGRYCWLRM